MTFPASALNAAGFLAALTAGTAADIPDLDEGSDMKCALFTDTMAETFTGATQLGYSGGSNNLTGEHANGNGYTTGGIVVVPTLEVASDILVWTLAADPNWAAATTFADVHGCAFYDDGPTNKPTVCGLHFATAGSSGGGAFTIQLSDSPLSETVFTIDPT